MSDLDNLKIVNDTFGHLAGDRLIQVAAARFARAVAPDVTFRIGGDEFAVLVQAPALPSDLDPAASLFFRRLELAAPCEVHMVEPQATIACAVFGLAASVEAAGTGAADVAVDSAM